MDRSPEKSASITVTIQPSRLADGEFFSSLLAQAIHLFGKPASTFEDHALTIVCGLQLEYARENNDPGRTNQRARSIRRV
jgi:hypothetical protein